MRAPVETMALTIPASMRSVTTRPCLATVMAPSESHDDEGLLVARHGFEDVGGVADLASGEGRAAHGADEIVNGVDFGKVEGIEGDEFV